MYVSFPRSLVMIIIYFCSVKLCKPFCILAMSQVSAPEFLIISNKEKWGKVKTAPILFVFYICPLNITLTQILSLLLQHHITVDISLLYICHWYKLGMCSMGVAGEVELPIIDHVKAPHLPHLLPPEEALLTPEKAGVRRASSGVRRVSLSVSRWGNCSDFPQTTTGHVSLICYPHVIWNVSWLQQSWSLVMCNIFLLQQDTYMHIILRKHLISIWCCVDEQWQGLYTLHSFGSAGRIGWIMLDWLD